MSTATTLLKRATALQKRLVLPAASKTWLAILEAGEAIPAELDAQLRPQDTLIIHEIPPGYMPEYEPVFYQLPA